jgi:hypothetical protein
MSCARALVTILIVASLVLLALNTTALAQTTEPYRAEQTTLTGGQYTLTSLDPSSFLESLWRVNGEVSGGNYRLSASPAPASAGSGCCCTYLPCITRFYMP